MDGVTKALVGACVPEVMGKMLRVGAEVLSITGVLPDLIACGTTRLGDGSSFRGIEPCG
jgi:hypothetical protein